MRRTEKFMGCSNQDINTLGVQQINEVFLFFSWNLFEWDWISTFHLASDNNSFEHYYVTNDAIIHFYCFLNYIEPLLLVHWPVPEWSSYWRTVIASGIGALTCPRLFRSVENSKNTLTKNMQQRLLWVYWSIQDYFTHWKTVIATAIGALTCPWLSRII